MTKPTKEFMQDIISGNGFGVAPSAVADMARQLLATMEQEPVAWRYRFVHTPKSEEHGSHFTTDWVLTHSDDECNPSDCFERQPLYAAPQLPQPAVVPTFDERCAATDNKPLGWVKDAMRDAYDGCRAAMLQGDEHSKIDMLCKMLKNAPLSPSDSQGRKRVDVENDNQQFESLSRGKK